MKKHLILVSVLALVLIFTATTIWPNLPSVTAQDATAQTQPAPTETPIPSASATTECTPGVVQRVENVFASFYAVTDGTLTTANLNSESLNYLFRTYRNLQKSLTNYKRSLVANIDQTNQESTALVQACSEYIDSAARDLRIGFLEVYTQLSSRKRDFILFERYDSINAQFEDLQEDLRVTTQNIQKFDDLLPCFATSCLSR
jgi:peptidoglycan hydrolase CwlO-like protein